MPRALAKKLLKNPRKMDPKDQSGQYTVIIENRVTGNIFSPVYQSLLGSSLYQKQSFLPDKINKPVASPLLTVYDDPLIPSGPGSRLYDREGGRC